MKAEASCIALLRNVSKAFRHTTNTIDYVQSCLKLKYSFFIVHFQMEKHCHTVLGVFRNLHFSYEGVLNISNNTLG